MRQLTRELIVSNPMMDQYMGVSKYVVSRIDGRACGVRRLPWLALMADMMRAQFPQSFNYLETGTMFGGSLCAVSCHRHKSASELYAGVDTFGGWTERISGKEVTVERAHRNVESFGPDGFALFEGNSKDPETSGRALAYLGENVHMIYIDGEHTSDGVRSDFATYAPHVVPGGVVVFDDYNDEACPDVSEAIDDLDKDGWNVVGPLAPDGTPTLFVMQKAHE